jgi:hypothetical protein
MDCKRYEECANADKSCFKCFSYSFFAPFKEIYSLQNKSSSRKQKKEGADFERRGVNKYNRAIEQGKKMARQQIASGAFSFALGDMVTEEEMTSSIAEFKERGELSAKGEKQITIKKQWLDKLEEEARMMKKDYFFLPFSFKDSQKEYVVISYDQLLSYIQTIHYLLQKK